MLQRTLQVLDALHDQLAQRASQQRGVLAAQCPGRVGVGHGRAQVDVDEDHAPGRVLEQGLAQRDGPLQIDLCVHLAERAVDPGGLAVLAAHARRLGTHEDAPAVLAQQRELVDLPPGRVHDRQQPALYVLRVRAPHGPPREAAPPDGLRGGPAEDAFGLAVPVGDGAVRVERAERGVHAVQQRGEEPGPRNGRRRRLPSGVFVGPERVGGPGAPGRTHSVPPAGRIPLRVPHYRTSDH